MNSKKILALVMLCSILVAIPSNAYAADITVSNGTGTAVATLTADPLAFAVTVPTALPVFVDAAGAVVVPDNLKITNASPGNVKITAINSKDGADGWKMVDYDSLDVRTAKVGTREIGMKINGCKSKGSGTFLIASPGHLIVPKFVYYDGVPMPGELNLVYDVKVPAQDTAVVKDVSLVEFVIEWDV